EQGDRRGEFIRVQCARAALPAEDPRRAELARREEEKFAAHGAAWAAALPPRHDNWQDLGVWKRGFPSGEQVSVPEYLDHIEEILRQEVMQDVVLCLKVDDEQSDPAWVERLAASPRLRLVRALQGPLTNFGAHRFGILIRSPHLTRLVDINLYEDMI